MSYPVWPSDLPRPIREAHGLDRQDTRRRRAGDLGAPNHGLRLSPLIKIMPLTVKLTRWQRGVFDQFHDETCAGGTIRFEMPDPTTDGWELLWDDGSAILWDDGTPVLDERILLCGWGDEPPREVGLQGQTFTISFEVYILP